ncbi:MAG: protein of unknown function containing DUF3859 domain [Rhodobacteraceae bacterium HLUCCA08]|nr:MAG: protein of unknown function containing DUF3859 domain [Rhodobacteraceae bacterium HLUCCA08]
MIVRALILAALPLASAAQQADFVSDRIATLEAGIVCSPPTIGMDSAPDTVAGATEIFEDRPDFISNGRRVPAVPGISFGVVSTSATGAIDPVTFRVIHPPFTGLGVTEQSFQTRIGPATTPGATYYGFDEPYELVHGTWVMEAWDGDDLLYRVQFTVVPPAAVPDLAGLCGFEDLLSLATGN